VKDPTQAGEVRRASPLLAAYKSGERNFRMSRSLVLKLVPLACLAVAAPAFAADKVKETPQFQTCMDNVDLGAMKNAQWYACYVEELSRQDKVLNTEYRALQGRIPPEAKDLLTKGQRAWIAYRDAWCKLEQELPNAPGGEVNFQSCMLEQTLAQINRLKDVF
jgi:uncharacterized protein YecT (DUF1311 family)